MDRRAFLTGTGALLAAPLAAEAQQAAKVPQIGYVGPTLAASLIFHQAANLVSADRVIE